MPTSTMHVTSGGKTKKISITVIRRCAFAAFAAVALAGCSSKIEQVMGDSKTITHVGFGNRIKLETCEIWPDDKVVAAGERVGVAAVNRMSDAAFGKAVDAISSGSQVR